MHAATGGTWVPRLHFNQTLPSSARMHDHSEHPLKPALASDQGDCELNILRDVFRLLPNVVTLQDEQGQLLLANDAAGASLAGSRRDIALECLRSGHPVVVEESIAG